MTLIKISATEARNRFFELIQMVAYKGDPVVIKKNNKDFVRIVAEKGLTGDFISIEEVIKQTYGMCANVDKEDWPYEKAEVNKKEKKANINWSE